MVHARPFRFRRRDDQRDSLAAFVALGQLDLVEVHRNVRVPVHQHRGFCTAVLPSITSATCTRRTASFAIWRTSSIRGPLERNWVELVWRPAWKAVQSLVRRRTALLAGRSRVDRLQSHGSVGNPRHPTGSGAIVAAERTRPRVGSAPLPGAVRRERAHVLGALERGGVGARGLAEAAACLVDRRVLVLGEPGREPADHGRRWAGPWRSSAEASITASAPARSSLTTSSAEWTPRWLRGRRDAAAQDRDPAQRQPELRRVSRAEPRPRPSSVSRSRSGW